MRGTKLTMSVLGIVSLVVATSSYLVWRSGLVGQNLEAINRFYVPALKSLNLFAGKWAAYHRSVEQYVQFPRWGEAGLDLGTPKWHVRKMLESNAQELSKLFENRPARTTASEEETFRKFLQQITNANEKEAPRLMELATLVRHHQLNEAIKLYSQLRKDHGALSQTLATLSDQWERSLSLLQLKAEEEVHNSNLVMLVLLVLTLGVCVVLTLRLQRWLRPLMEWREAAQQMVKHITRSGFQNLKTEVKLPELTRNAPPEVALLTREFKNMATTVIEYEKTIRDQKNKLESLNIHLKSQNELLKKLGSLNERVLNTMGAGLVVLDGNGHIEQFNERFCEIFQIPKENILNISLHQVSQGWDSSLMQEWLKLSEPKAYRRIQHQSGKFFNIDVQLLPAVGAPSAPGRMLTFDDVTSLVESEERLAHARKLALAGQMSAQVAHEIRNPLNSLSLHLELLQEDLVDQGLSYMKNRTEQMNSQIERLERLTEKYLNVTQGAITETTQHRSVNIHELIERTLVFFSPQLQNRQIQVELNLNSKEIFVNADSDRLTQVLVNLIQNAMESLEDAPLVRRRLYLRTEIQDHECIVTVQDQGLGIPQQIRHHLFEPFITSKTQGHGLGLSLSRQVCLEHGGDLKYIEQAEGACFEVHLPC